MHVKKEAIPVQIDVPGATARQLPDFGVGSDGAIGAEYFTLGAGTDLAPLLKGLDGDMCHSPHWGYLISGELVVDYRDGSSETCTGGEVFHWPAGHSVRAETDTEVILFSPQVEHGAVLDHVKAQLAAAT